MHKTSRILLAFTLLFCVYDSNGSTNKDSLLTIWNNQSETNSTRINAIHNLIWDHYTQTNQDSGIHLAEQYLEFAKKNGKQRDVADALLTAGRLYARKGSSVVSNTLLDQSLRIAEEIGDSLLIGECYSVKGSNENGTGDLLTGHKFLLKALAINKKTGNQQFEAYDYGNLGNIFAALGMYEEAKDYYSKMKDLSGNKDNAFTLAATTSNLGLLYLQLGDTTKALEFKMKGLQLSINGDFLAFQANNYHDLLNIYIARNQLDSSIKYLNDLKIVSEKLNNPVYYSFYHYAAGAIHLMQKKYQKAVVDCQKAYDLSIEGQVPEIEKSSCTCLYMAYKGLGNDRKALEYFELIDLINTKDQKEKMKTGLQREEFKNQLAADSLQQLEEKRIVQEAHQQEVAKKNRTRNILGTSGLIVLLIAGGLYSRNRYIQKAKNVIEEERDRSDNLLLNILPEEIAKELKEKGKADARDFDMVSMLFTDFKQFTQASEKLSAQVLVGEINACFEAFDAIMEKYSIEKIKTIGDAYMAAGGLPIPSDDSVKNTILAGLEMQEFIVKRKKERDEKGLPAFEMRVGIHTGPVVAGIVGVKKFQYDIWGDTVNTANRMESYSADGMVNISKATYDLVKEEPEFEFESRGKIEVKGKGEMEMFFVSRSLGEG